MAWTTLCRLDELKEAVGRYVEIAPFQLAVFLYDGKPHVIDNYCPHAGGNLAGGVIDDGCAVCPWHHWAFRLDSGQLTESAYVRVATYPARVVQENGIAQVEADLPIGK